ncbi:hypothetical protein [Streptomyces rishiriensis]|uniref:Integral membrane protein n=1 Tax=Streptomyces rishiriensis TaxID=68264 RepID=A0ABU0NG59_STRRH|nr:hypothetical protein [Streptomyces rishiriensis]MDQ0578084.1 hypothetical protein [Streptomyces rishiriensis]
MRSIRFILAGIPLSGAAFLLCALLAQPPHRVSGVVAAAIFCPLWFALCAANALGGVADGHSARIEAGLAGAIFAGPAAVSLLLWWASRTWWNDGPLITASRTAWVLTAGILLWAGTAQLTAVWRTAGSPVRAMSAAAAVFSPLWAAVMVVNLLLGLSVGYTLMEEIPVLLVNLAVPVGVALIARTLPVQNRIRR